MGYVLESKCLLGEKDVNKWMHSQNEIVDAKTLIQVV